MKKINLIALLTLFIFINIYKSDGNISLKLNKTQQAPNHNTLKTAGFFLNEWKFKTFTVPEYTKTVQPSGTATVVINISTRTTKQKISPYINGNNSNTYSGQMINEPVLVNNIKKLSPGVIRFPGGDISSLYFWDRDKWHKPTDVPEKLSLSGKNITPTIWYGKNNEPWTLSLNNYYALLKSTSTTGMITVNYGYARYGTSAHPVEQAAHLAANWVRYDNGRTKFWEVGNESFGYWEAGYKIDNTLNQDRQPQIMNGEIYAQHFKIFADSMRKAAAETGHSIKIGAQLIGRTKPSGINPAEADWNSSYFKIAGDAADYYIVHEYYTPFGENTSAQDIFISAINQTQNVVNYLQHSFGQSHRQEKPVAMTEWNIFATGSNQHVSTIAGMHAVICMNEMLKKNFGMAARWGLLGKYTNGDDFGTLSIGDEPENSEKWLPRPVFYYMYYFNHLLGDELLDEIPTQKGVIAYGSKFHSGAISVTLINTGTHQQTIKLAIDKKLKYYYYYLLTGNEGITFSRKVFVNGLGPGGVSGGPKNYENLPAYRGKVKGAITITVPQYGTAFLVAANN